jgi:hypothetical protein
VQTGSFYEGISGALGGLPDYADALLSGAQPVPGSSSYNAIQEGIGAVGNTDVGSDLARKLDTGEITSFENRLGRANAFVVGENIYVSRVALSFDLGTRATLLGHEYFHVLENRTFGFGMLLRTRNEAYADFFGIRVAGGLRMPAYAGNPQDLFSGILAGRYDNHPLMRTYLRDRGLR